MPSESAAPDQRASAAPALTPNPGQQTASNRRHVVICGLGALAARVTELLLPSHDIWIISKGHDEWLAAAVDCPGVTLFELDFLRAEMLAQMNLGRSRALLALTGDDFTNLTVALRTRELASDVPILVRLADPEQAAAMGRHLPKAAVLSLPSLSAPSLGLAAYTAGHHLRRERMPEWRDVFDVGDHPWLSAVLRAGNEADATQHAPGPVARTQTVAEFERQWSSRRAKRGSPAEMTHHGRRWQTVTIATTRPGAEALRKAQR